jgi:hypothetical protein
MENSVFIDKIGEIYKGDVESANENYEKYKNLSLDGIGSFANNNVYLIASNGSILKSHGKTAFKDGGEVATDINVIKDFLIGKKINTESVNELGFTALQSDKESVLIFKNKDGEYPLVRYSNGSAIFYKSNFSENDYVNSLMGIFKEVCLKNAITFKVD